MTAFYQELKIALQSLSRRKGFVITVVATLSITLGALITFFNLNHVLLVKPLPYPQHEQLMLTQHVTIDSKGSTNQQAPFVPGLLHTYKHQESFESMAILSHGYEFLTSHNEQPRLAVKFTTPEYFELFAMPMHIGRGFNATEGLDQHNPVVVLSFEAWQRWFSGNEQVIGSKLQLRNTSFTIIGVAAESFVEPEMVSDGSDVWAPWDFNGMSDMLLQSWNNGQGTIAGIGRLNTGSHHVEVESVLSASLNGAYQNFLLGVENRNELNVGMRISLEPLKDRLLGNSHYQGLLLMAAVFGLLLIASANVINLFYSRVAEKQRTFAIQAALGARKKHLFSSMFVESLVLTLTAGLLGLLVAMWGIDLVKSLGQEQFNRLEELGLNAAAFVFMLMMAIILAAVFSFFSSKVVNYEKLKEQLQSSGKGSGLQISKTTRNILVVSQISLACLLLVGATLVLGKAYSVINQPLGYDSKVLHSFSLDVRAGLIEEDEVASRDQYIRELTTRLETLPQVNGLAPTFNTAMGYNMTMDVVDRENNKRGTFPANFVAANYFETMQLPLVEGRNFSEEEVRDRNPVVVLSRSAANHVQPNGSVVGMKFTVGGGEFRTVIGVVEDVFDPVRTGSNQGQDTYLPHAPWNIHFVMRLKPGTELNRQQLVSIIRDVDSGLRLASYRSFSERHDRVIRQDIITGGVAAALSLLALLLAGAGIYGVLSYSSHMRRYELGVRMALGAKAKEITTLIIRDNMKPITVGLVISTIVVLAVYFIGRQQFDLFKEYSLLPLMLTLPVILITAFMASYIPVRKVILKDPMKSLRNE